MITPIICPTDSSKKPTNTMCGTITGTITISPPNPLQEIINECNSELTLDHNITNVKSKINIYENYPQPTVYELSCSREYDGLHITIIPVTK